MRSWSLALSSVPLFALLVLGGCAPAGPGPRTDAAQRAWFETDVLTGVGEGGHPRATVTVTVPRRNLVFFQSDDGFVARYRVRTIQRLDGRAVRMQEWPAEVHADTYAQTQQPDVERRTVAVDLLDESTDPRRFEFEVRVEIEGTRRSASRVVALQTRRVQAGGLTLGDLALYRPRLRDVRPDAPVLELGDQLPDGSGFRRQENRSFDLATGEPWLLVRIFDLREGDPPAPYAITARVVAGEGAQTRWTQTFDIAAEGDETSALIRLPAEAFTFGTNRVRVSLPGTEPVEVALENLGLDLADEKSWNANLEQIEVLASGDEMRRLREAPVDQRLSQWDAFWSRRDPDPSTPENERLEEHYRRVAYARSFLQDGFRDGALSDRGRIWVLHGRPDSIETTAQGFESYANYEVWTYLESGLVYYFQDTDGFGAYRLVWREVR